ncbi:MAG: FtsX-like permease family protein [Gemmatimonadota bacterium]|nr:FtsX-like permease family protein [Gemmatimonadota bacterium]
MTAAVRTTGDAQAVLPALRAAVWSVDRRVPIANLAPLPDLIAATTARRQFALRLFGVFAALAVVLAASGLYGVLSAMVAEGTREIGIRGALGASRGGILRLVLGQSVRFALVGLGSGLVLSLLGARLLGSLLYGVAPWDPLTVAGVSAVLLGVAVLAAGLPAVRAARIDPADALRSV